MQSMILAVLLGVVFSTKWTFALGGFPIYEIHASIQKRNCLQLLNPYELLVLTSIINKILLHSLATPSSKYTLRLNFPFKASCASHSLRE